MHTEAALHAFSLHNSQNGKRLSPRSTPVSTQAVSESQAGARISRLAIDAVTPRKGAGLLTRIDAPAKLLLAALVTPL